MYKITERKPISLTFIITSARFNNAIEATLLKYHELLEEAQQDDDIDDSLVVEHTGARLRFHGWRNSIMHVAQPLLDQLKLLKVEPVEYVSDYPEVEYNETLMNYIQQRASYDSALEYFQSVFDDIYYYAWKELHGDVPQHRLGFAAGTGEGKERLFVELHEADPDSVNHCDIYFRRYVYLASVGREECTESAQAIVKEVARRRSRLRIEQVEAFKPLLPMYNQLIEACGKGSFEVQDLRHDCNPMELAMAAKLVMLFRPDYYKALVTSEEARYG